ncbi:hypothetical protein HA402_007129 [Bradysia odoriphaga]|nr:hypothetical protein HA402_007129 [Bradysia odoriphaga]
MSKPDIKSLLKNVYKDKEESKNQSDCDICGEKKCSRHLNIPSWKGLFVDQGLDEAVDRFYTRILTSFVESWFSLLSKDEDFVQALKQNLREATCRLIIKLKELNAPELLTNKLLPCIFSHYETIKKMLDDGVSLDKLAKTVVLNDRAVHLAVLNRQTEIDYLRSVSTFLIPRLSSNENFNSKVFFSLVRELLTCWVLLPLMDVISDPNLINLLIILATNKSHNSVMKKPQEKVAFLDKFAQRNYTPSESDCNDESFLTDQKQLYSFMQFLKKDGEVDLLRFYLDVDSLNNELQALGSTDPTKLSVLFQQSEKLMKTYQTLAENEKRQPATTLIEAHEDVKRILHEKWKNVFHTTPEYFRLKYGSNELHEIEDARPTESQSVFRLGSKLKGAIRGAPTSVEATEVPTVWDAFTDEPALARDNSSNIYSSVAQKLRKERGQNLENFVTNFMQSIEPNIADVGEDVILMNEKKTVPKKPQPPGRNFVFGDLFELKYHPKYLNQTVQVHNVRGPSQCLIYILVKILNTPMIIVKFILALINISQKFIDGIINLLIDKLIKFGLYEPRLTVLINELENQLFGPKQTDPSITELLERQRQAKLRLEKVRKGLGNIADILQSPALNKHLMYCLFDIIVLEIYPELATKE